jgi:hypothetical protein
VASANEELVRSIFHAFEHGDFSAADWAHPEIEFVLKRAFADLAISSEAGSPSS